jgi:hypothetical protein
MPAKAETNPIAAASVGGFLISATGCFTAIGGYGLLKIAPRLGKALAVGGTGVMVAAGSVSAVATTYKIYYC